MSADQLLPSSRSTAIPCLHYRDANAAIEWLGRAFGLVKKAAYPGPDGKIMHAELTYGGGMIMLGSAGKEGEYGKMIAQPDEIEMRETVTIYLVVRDADATYATAKEAGATMILDIEDKDYGGKSFTCRDLEGHIWSIGSYDPWA
jgi:uncharacterized glyoxalase superfamily protein PhnB